MARVATRGTHDLPPRTRGMPLVGVLPRLVRNPHRFLLEARERYGDAYTLDLGVTRLVVLNSPHHAEHLLRESSHDYTKAGPVWDLLRTVIGNGLATSGGDFWLRQRRMMQPSFHRQRLPEIAALMTKAIDEGLRPWQAYAGRRIDVAPACGKIAMRVLMKTMFGEDIAEAELATMTNAVTFMLEYATWAMVAAALPGWLPMPGRRRYRRTLRQIDAYASGVIAERRAGGGSADLISMLLAMTDGRTGARMTDREIRDEAFTIFMAGYETTALTLAWALYFLAKDPGIKQEVHREIDDVLGTDPPSLENIAELRLTNRVLKETLRLRPPAFWLPRTAVNDGEIDGYRIPAGTNLGLLIFGIHHHPRHWRDPERFDPGRFAPESEAERDANAWIPFGAGQRLCIGKDFALLEAQLALAAILQRHDFHAPPDYVVAPRFMSTLRPRGGVRLAVEQRGCP